ncbi:hypothetical protein B2I21_29750 [Chryseobacterium mucoviscidosis]|uniref:hypothetical protein n=1 Tax=unclassified Paenibacillus TaxID=185978 RepID=UPI0009A312DD|nr:hypothetical protein [Paenibacillus sp. 11B]MDN8591732.1 hypothetical protein [Paenibacillus sp. 11B]OPG94718.1 hypothetical protein B2I21_29750 [Chryseobacterium mucoviscidosis]
MRKKGYLTSAMLLLFTCTVFLSACDAITAQNITNTGSAQGMNGGGMMNGGGPGMNGGTQRGGGQGMNGRTGSTDEMRGMMNADLTGRVISVEGSTVTIALLEVQDNSTTGSTNGNGRQPGVSRGGSTDMKDTGIEMKLNIGDDVNISQGMGMGAPGNNQSADSSIQVSDLKEGDVVMVWYKENTETVERMVVTQS